MANESSGTPKGINLDGLIYRFAFDVDINSIIGKTANEFIATSGIPMEKRERRVETKEVVLIVNGEETERLRNLANANEDFQMSIEDAAGDWHRTTGKINIDSKASSENRMTVMLLPRDPEGWTVTVV